MIESSLWCNGQTTFRRSVLLCIFGWGRWINGQGVPRFSFDYDKMICKTKTESRYNARVYYDFEQGQASAFPASATCRSRCPVRGTCCRAESFVSHTYMQYKHCVLGERNRFEPHHTHRVRSFSHVRCLHGTGGLCHLSIEK